VGGLAAQQTGESSHHACGGNLRERPACTHENFLSELQPEFGKFFNSGSRISVVLVAFTALTDA
jgi:hypothetical protein